METAGHVTICGVAMRRPCQLFFGSYSQDTLEGCVFFYTRVNGNTGRPMYISSIKEAAVGMSVFSDMNLIASGCLEPT